MYIHYGHKQFLKSRFEEIRNQKFTKPYGGLWGSDVYSEYGWKEWCEDNGFRECEEEKAFYFELAPEAYVLHIRKLEDLAHLPENRKADTGISYAKSIDFEALKASGVDAIELHLSNDHRLYWGMYGWDCDSIVILNPDIVEEVELYDDSRSFRS